MLSSILRHQRSPSSLLLSRQFHSSGKKLLAVNALEESLELAATDPSHRPQFYRDLLTSSIFVIPAPRPEGAKTQGLYLQQWQIPIQGQVQAVIPFFSSLENLQEFQFDLPEKEPHAELKCRTFFELVVNARGANIVLNPGLPYGKAFSYKEITGLLDGSLLAPEMSDISAGQEVFIGKPQVYPTALMNALSDLFRDFDSVQAAYIAHVWVVESGEPPHSVIGLQLTNPEALPVILEFAMNIQQQVLPDELVDFVSLPNNINEHDSEEKDDVIQYLLKTEPFYKKEGE